MYRDSCEWENLESIFAPNAYIYTTWTGKTSYQDFIKVSKEGMDRGAFIMHRCLGASTDINEGATRAVTKLKATITQRFVLDGCEVDVSAVKQSVSLPFEPCRRHRLTFNDSISGRI